MSKSPHYRYVVQVCDLETSICTPKATTTDFDTAECWLRQHGFVAVLSGIITSYVNTETIETAKIWMVEDFQA